MTVRAGVGLVLTSVTILTLGHTAENIPRLHIKDCIQQTRGFQKCKVCV